jgi:hypothetical protein
MRGAIPPLPEYVFMAWCLVKAEGQFAFEVNRKRKFKKKTVGLSLSTECRQRDSPN